MKTFILDLIPKLQRFSQKLDNLTLLSNQHWVVLDNATNKKVVYIFRENNDLLISQNGKIEKAKWEYLGNNSLYIDRKDEAYLFKHGFFDENILALKIDSKEEYVFFINENKSEGELNSFESIIDFLTNKYIHPNFESKDTISKKISSPSLIKKGNIEIEVTLENNLYYFKKGQKVFISGRLAPNGKYKIGFMEYIYVEHGIIKKITSL